MIDADLTFLNNKIFRMMEDPRIAFKSLYDDEQIVRVGYIFDLAQSAIHMFNIDLGDISLSTEIFLIFLDDIPCVDNIGLVVSPVE